MYIYVNNVYTYCAYIYIYIYICVCKYICVCACVTVGPMDMICDVLLRCWEKEVFYEEP